MKLNTVTINGVRYVRAKAIRGEVAAIESAAQRLEVSIHGYGDAAHAMSIFRDELAASLYRIRVAASPPEKIGGKGE